MILRPVAILLLLGLFLPGAALVAEGGAGDLDKADAESAASDPDKNPYTGDPDAIAEGKKLWRKTGCYSCHGGTAEGGVGPSLIDDEWVYKPTDKTLFKTISQGRPGTVMVAWSKELSDDQIWKLIAYIRSLYQGDPGKIIW